jgi:hypothetical protein
MKLGTRPRTSLGVPRKRSSCNLVPGVPPVPPFLTTGKQKGKRRGECALEGTTGVPRGTAGTAGTAVRR